MIARFALSVDIKETPKDAAMRIVPPRQLPARAASISAMGDPLALRARIDLLYCSTSYKLSTLCRHFPVHNLVLSDCARHVVMSTMRCSPGGMP